MWSFDNMQLIVYLSSLNVECLIVVNCHAMPCIIEMDIHHVRLCIISCMCRGKYRVLILVSGLLRLDRVLQAYQNVRTRSTTSVRLFHGVIRLPSWIPGKMTISLDTITIIAMLVVPFLSLCLVAYHMLNVSFSTLPWKPSTCSQPSKPLIGYVTAC